MNELKWTNSQKWSETLSFYCEIELSLQSLDLIFQKCSKTDSFFQCLSEIALSLQSCSLFVDQFPRSSRATAKNRDPPSATTAATLPEKTQGFTPESVFKPAFTRSRALTLPNYLMMMMMMVMMMMMLMMMWLTWWCGWHDDVVDMMMWLTWWCGWHDDVFDMMMWLTWWCGWHDDWDDVVAMLVRQLAMTIVRNSEVS